MEFDFPSQVSEPIFWDACFTPHQMQVYCRRIHCCWFKMCPHRQSDLDYWPCWWNVQLCAQV